MLAEVGEGLTARLRRTDGPRRGGGAGAAPAAASARYEPDASAPGWLIEQILAQQDHGVRRLRRRREVPARLAPLRLALAHAEITRDERLEALLTRTFDAMAWGGIFDEVDGGFFRYAAAREWTRPHTEKMLEDQAAMVGLLIDRLDRLRARELARTGARRDAVRAAHARRHDAGGGFYASQRADEDYYAVNASIRETLDPPVVDRTLFTDLNAQAAVPGCAPARCSTTSRLGRFAVQSLERVLLATYKPGEGVAHYHDASGEVRGLLSDQVHAAWALLHVHDATGDETYLMLAEELARTRPAHALGRTWRGLSRPRARRSRRHRPAAGSREAAGPQLPRRPRARPARGADRARGTAGPRTRDARIADRRLPLARHRRRAVWAGDHGRARRGEVGWRGRRAADGARA